MQPLSDTVVTALVGIASALIGATVAIAAAWLTNRANTRVAAAARAHELALRAQDLRRSRGEELYTTLQQWLNRLYGYYIVKQSVIAGKITYNQGLDLELRDRDRNDVSHVRIEMLIDVYFPALRPQYSKLIQVRDYANKIVAEHKSQYSVGQTDGTSYMRPFEASLQELNAAATELTNALLQKLRDA